MKQARIVLSMISMLIITACAGAGAAAPTTVPPSRPNVVNREFTRTRSIDGGSTRGVTALRNTEKDLDSTIIPSAHG